MSGSNPTPPNYDVFLAANPAYGPGTFPFQLTVNPDFQDPPTITVSPSGLGTVTLGADISGTYDAVFTPAGPSQLGVATISAQVEGQTPQVLCTITVGIEYEGLTFVPGVPTPPVAPPAPPAS